MSRVISLDSAGKQRNVLMKSTALALRELFQCKEVNDQARDLAAYISLALAGVAETIEPSVAAWEKRDYWVKADRFRMDWAWAGSLSGKMRQALMEDDWARVADIAVQAAAKVQSIKLPAKNRSGDPWTGAWQRLQAEHLPT